jgi:hypothetical protein
MSNEKKLNDIISKKYIKYLFILLIIYFIYQNYNFTLLVIILLIIILFNVDIKEKFVNNYFMKYENFKNLLTEYFKDSNEKFSNKSYDITPFTDNIDTNIIRNIDENENENKNKNKIEPFKTEVLKLKDLYENIKMELTKLK